LTDLRTQLRSRAPTLALLLLGLPMLSCVYDADAPCGDEFKLKDGLCVCREGFVLKDEGCVTCGRNEIARATGCECRAGTVRPGAGQACQAIPDSPIGQGVSCSEDSPCEEATFDHCRSEAEGVGYCTTTGCSSAGDCEGGYTCDLSLSPSLCRRPPVGAGQACASPDDCAGTDALWCDVVVSQTCLVQGCSLDPDNCFTGTECCDLSAFGVPEPLCLTEGTCAP
jgi:hypothetical protein